MKQGWWCRSPDDAKVVFLRGRRALSADGGPMSQGRAAPDAGRLPLIVYRGDGTPKSEWRFAPGASGRIRGPAYVQRRLDGSRIEHWYRESRLHRTDGPAVIEWTEDGCIRKAEWWIDGQDVTSTAEAFLSDTRARWPLDPGHESVFLCRQVVRGEGGATVADRLSWHSLVVGLCLVGPFWMLITLSIVFLD
ncbi:hypothetical protein ACFW16_28735 [Inquilinus sp. NPDC058860]|uniref:hypothetical protein n=1 Tax=Inquilinus sp. NPDC058860 TaxID=3346652 RepID=UPI00367FF014